MRQKWQQLRTQIKNCTRVWHFRKTYDAGCCEHQGVQHRGYRLIIIDEYVIECGLWGRREHCGRHSDGCD